MDKAEKNILCARSGMRQVKFRYDLLRGGAVIGTLPVISASVSYSAEDEIKRTASISMAEIPQINWLTDYIRPAMLVRGDDVDAETVYSTGTWAQVKKLTWQTSGGMTWNGIKGGTAVVTAKKERWLEYHLGVFIPETPTRTYNVSAMYNVEAYDLSVILREDCVTSRYYIAAGTNYISAIMTLMNTANITSVIATSTGLMLPTDREFDIGTSKLEIINTLLTEINYNTVTVDPDGVFLLRPYVEPSPDSITLRYGADDLSVLGTPATTVMDLYSVPNIFIAMVSSSEMEDMKSIYTNDNPVSELSTIRRGRNIVSQIYKPDVIASQTELDAYIRRIAFAASQVYEEVEIETMLMPIHGDSEVLEIHHPDIDGIYQERGWSMELIPGGRMSHRVRRIVSI